MAYLTQCSVCGGNTLNSQDHTECRIAHLKDIIVQVKKHLEQNPALPLPQELQAKILQEPVEPLEHFFAKKAAEQERAGQKALWESARDAVRQRATEQWEKENPDPDPVRF